jgi:hypothetical protein
MEEMSGVTLDDFLARRRVERGDGKEPHLQRRAAWRRGYDSGNGLQ